MDETLKRRLIGVAVLSLIVLAVAWWLPDRDDGQTRMNPERLPTETRVYDIHQLGESGPVAQSASENVTAAEAASPPNVETRTPAIIGARAMQDPPATQPTDEATEPASPSPAPVATAAVAQPKPKPQPKPTTQSATTTQSDAEAKPAVAPKPEPVPAPTTAPRAATETASPSPTVEAQPALTQGDWVVQVGSYGNESNAKAERAKLEAKGYRVEVTSSNVNGRVVHRVRVGPYLEKVDAQGAAASIEELLGRKVAVLRNH